MCGKMQNLLGRTWRIRWFATALGGVIFGASIGARLQGEESQSCPPEAWAHAIKAFEKQDAKEPPPQGAVVFVGSSSIRLWDLKKSFPDLPAVNRGFGGSQMCDSAHYAEQLVIKLHPRVVVLYAGDNDIAAGKKPEQVHHDFRDFTEKVRKGLPEARLIFISIKPSVARWKLADKMREANKLIAADCEKDEKLKFLDVWPVMLGPDGQPRKEIFRDDNLHMTEAGYAEWTKLLRPLLEDNHEGTEATKK
jgi:lysophospholipase L1-like esterase